MLGWPGAGAGPAGLWAWLGLRVWLTGLHWLDSLGFSEFRCAQKFASWTAMMKTIILAIFEIRIVEKYHLHCSCIFSCIFQHFVGYPLSVLLLGGAVPSLA